MSGAALVAGSEERVASRARAAALILVGSLVAGPLSTHVYWVLGGTWGLYTDGVRDDAASTGVRIVAAVVVVLLVVAVLVVLARVGLWQQHFVSERMIRLFAWALAGVFLLETLAGLTWSRGEPLWWLYAPASLVIAVLALVVAGSGGQWRHRRVLRLLAALGVAAVIPISVDRIFFATQTRAEFMQHTLDGLVTGPNKLAPGATAYVSGPHGVWLGSAGVADVKTGKPMPVDARMRIESNSKTWLVAAILQLVQERKLSLEDTVEQWLPGLLRAHGSEITLRALVSDSSGLIDDNDIANATPAENQARLARVRDPKLRSQLLAVVARVRANPAAQVSPLVWIRLAAWQPLVAPPGTAYHHSNIGWNIAGLIAAKASGKPLPTLYRERIFQPLRLRHTAYDPQGPIAGAHAKGYVLAANGTLTDTTAWHYGKGADGAIVTDAKDEATFLTAFTDGTLLDPNSLGELGAGDPSGCSGPLVHSTNGAGDGFKSDVYYAVDGSRVAVLLLNGRTSGETEFARSAGAAAKLYCAG